MNTQPWCQLINNQCNSKDCPMNIAVPLQCSSYRVSGGLKGNKQTPKNPQLILIRGLPGSGKSTLAKAFNAVHLETDMYFIDENGGYQFDPLLLTEAHKWCLQQCEYHLNRGEDVVVSNTFVKQWEMDDYRKLAHSYKATLSINTCIGDYGNIHGLSPQTLAKMKKNWQH